VRRVAQIVDRVKRSGDAALIAYARRFDNLTLPIEVTADEMQAGRAS
jgi:histidinol dehydrogenase